MTFKRRDRHFAKEDITKPKHCRLRMTPVLAGLCAGGVVALGAAATACSIPARRATRVNPIKALPCAKTCLWLAKPPRKAAAGKIARKIGRPTERQAASDNHRGGEVFEWQGQADCQSAAGCQPVANLPHNRIVAAREEADG